MMNISRLNRLHKNHKSPRCVSATIVFFLLHLLLFLQPREAEGSLTGCTSIAEVGTNRVSELSTRIIGVAGTSVLVASFERSFETPTLFFQGAPEGVSVDLRRVDLRDGAYPRVVVVPSQHEIVRADSTVAKQSTAYVWLRLALPHWTDGATQEADSLLLPMVPCSLRPNFPQQVVCRIPPLPYDMTSFDNTTEIEASFEWNSLNFTSNASPQSASIGRLLVDPLVDPVVVATAPTALRLRDLWILAHVRHPEQIPSWVTNELSSSEQIFAAQRQRSAIMELQLVVLVDEGSSSGSDDAPTRNTIRCPAQVVARHGATLVTLRCAVALFQEDVALTSFPSVISALKKMGTTQQFHLRLAVMAEEESLFIDSNINGASSSSSKWTFGVVEAESSTISLRKKVCLIAPIVLKTSARNAFVHLRAPRMVEFTATGSLSAFAPFVRFANRPCTEPARPLTLRERDGNFSCLGRLSNAAPDYFSLCGAGIRVSLYQQVQTPSYSSAYLPSLEAVIPSSAPPLSQITVFSGAQYMTTASTSSSGGGASARIARLDFAYTAKADIPETVRFLCVASSNSGSGMLELHLHTQSLNIGGATTQRPPSRVICRDRMDGTVHQKAKFFKENVGSASEEVFRLAAGERLWLSAIFQLGSHTLASESVDFSSFFIGRIREPRLAAPLRPTTTLVSPSVTRRLLLRIRCRFTASGNAPMLYLGALSTDRAKLTSYQLSSTPAQNVTKPRLVPLIISDGTCGTFGATIATAVEAAVTQVLLGSPSNSSAVNASVLPLFPPPTTAEEAAMLQQQQQELEKMKASQRFCDAIIAIDYDAHSMTFVTEDEVSGTQQQQAQSWDATSSSLQDAEYRLLTLANATLPSLNDDDEERQDNANNATTKAVVMLLWRSDGDGAAIFVEHLCNIDDASIATIEALPADQLSALVSNASDHSGSAPPPLCVHAETPSIAAFNEAALYRTSVTTDEPSSVDRPRVLSFTPATISTGAETFSIRGLRLDRYSQRQIQRVQQAILAGGDASATMTTTREEETLSESIWLQQVTTSSMDVRNGWGLRIACDQNPRCDYHACSCGIDVDRTVQLHASAGVYRLVHYDPDLGATRFNGTGYTVWLPRVTSASWASNKGAQVPILQHSLLSLYGVDLPFERTDQMNEMQVDLWPLLGQYQSETAAVPCRIVNTGIGSSQRSQVLLKCEQRGVRAPPTAPIDEAEMLQTVRYMVRVRFPRLRAVSGRALQNRTQFSFAVAELSWDTFNLRRVADREFLAALTLRGGGISSPDQLPPTVLWLNSASPLQRPQFSLYNGTRNDTITICRGTRDNTNTISQCYLCVHDTAVNSTTITTGSSPSTSDTPIPSASPTPTQATNGPNSTNASSSASDSPAPPPPVTSASPLEGSSRFYTTSTCTVPLPLPEGNYTLVRRQPNNEEVTVFAFTVDLGIRAITPSIVSIGGRGMLTILGVGFNATEVDITVDGLVCATEGISAAATPDLAEQTVCRIPRFPDEDHVVEEISEFDGVETTVVYRVPRTRIVPVVVWSKVNGLPLPCLVTDHNGCAVELSNEVTPIIDSVFPTKGQVDSVITVSGRDFTADMRFYIGDVVECTVLLLFKTWATCRISEPVGRGSYQVVGVTEPLGLTVHSSRTKSLYEATFSVSGVTPSAGSCAGGLLVSIHGIGFPSVVNVTLASFPCVVQTSTPTLILCTTTATNTIADYVGPIVVLDTTNVVTEGAAVADEWPWMISSLPSQTTCCLFSYLVSKTPIVTQISPNDGQSGALLTLEGTTLSLGAFELQFGTYAQSGQCDRFPNRISCAAPTDVSGFVVRPVLVFEEVGLAHFDIAALKERQFRLFPTASRFRPANLVLYGGAVATALGDSFYSDQPGTLSEAIVCGVRQQLIATEYAQISFLTLPIITSDSVPNFVPRKLTDLLYRDVVSALAAAEDAGTSLDPLGVPARDGMATVIPTKLSVARIRNSTHVPGASWSTKTGFAAVDVFAPLHGGFVLEDVTISYSSSTPSASIAKATLTVLGKRTNPLGSEIAFTEWIPITKEPTVLRGGQGVRTFTLSINRYLSNAATTGSPLSVWTGLRFAFNNVSFLHTNVPVSTDDQFEAFSASGVVATVSNATVSQQSAQSDEEEAALLTPRYFLINDVELWGMAADPDDDGRCPLNVRVQMGGTEGPTSSCTSPIGAGCQQFLKQSLQSVQPPTVTGFRGAPTFGVVGDEVFLSGSNFGAPSIPVYIVLGGYVCEKTLVELAGVHCKMTNQKPTFRFLEQQFREFPDVDFDIATEKGGTATTQAWLGRGVVAVSRYEMIYLAKLWSLSATWTNGNVPVPQASSPSIVIGPGEVVRMDIEPAPFGTLFLNAGTLILPPSDKQITLHVACIIATNGSRIVIGSPTQPRTLSTRIVFDSKHDGSAFRSSNNYGRCPGGFDGYAWGTFLISGSHLQMVGPTLQLRRPQLAVPAEKGSLFALFIIQDFDLQSGDLIYLDSSLANDVSSKTSNTTQQTTRQIFQQLRISKVELFTSLIGIVYRVVFTKPLKYDFPSERRALRIRSGSVIYLGPTEVILHDRSSAHLVTIEGEEHAPYPPQLIISRAGERLTSNVLLSQVRFLHVGSASVAAVSFDGLGSAAGSKISSCYFYRSGSVRVSGNTRSMIISENMFYQSIASNVTSRSGNPIAVLDLSPTHSLTQSLTVTSNVILSCQGFNSVGVSLSGHAYHAVSKTTVTRCGTGFFVGMTQGTQRASFLATNAAGLTRLTASSCATGVIVEALASDEDEGLQWTTTTTTLNSAALLLSQIDIIWCHTGVFLKRWNVVLSSTVFIDNLRSLHLLFPNAEEEEERAPLLLGANSERATIRLTDTELIVDHRARPKPWLPFYYPNTSITLNTALDFQFTEFVHISSPRAPLLLQLDGSTTMDFNQFGNYTVNETVVVAVTSSPNSNSSTAGNSTTSNNATQLLQNQVRYVPGPITAALFVVVDSSSTPPNSNAEAATTASLMTVKWATHLSAFGNARVRFVDPSSGSSSSTRNRTPRLAVQFLPSAVFTSPDQSAVEANVLPSTLDKASSAVLMDSLHTVIYYAAPSTNTTTSSPAFTGCNATATVGDLIFLGSSHQQRSTMDERQVTLCAPRRNAVTPRNVTLWRLDVAIQRYSASKIGDDEAGASTLPSLLIQSTNGDTTQIAALSNITRIVNNNKNNTKMSAFSFVLTDAILQRTTNKNVIIDLALQSKDLHRVTLTTTPLFAVPSFPFASPFIKNQSISLRVNESEVRYLMHPNGNTFSSRMEWISQPRVSNSGNNTANITRNNASSHDRWLILYNTALQDNVCAKEVPCVWSFASCRTPTSSSCEPLVVEDSVQKAVRDTASWDDPSAWPNGIVPTPNDPTATIVSILPSQDLSISEETQLPREMALLYVKGNLTITCASHDGITAPEVELRVRRLVIAGTFVADVSCALRIVLLGASNSADEMPPLWVESEGRFVRDGDMLVTSSGKVRLADTVTPSGHSTWGFVARSTPSELSAQHFDGSDWPAGCTRPFPWLEPASFDVQLFTGTRYDPSIVAATEYSGSSLMNQSGLCTLQLSPFTFRVFRTSEDEEPDVDAFLSKWNNKPGRIYAVNVARYPFEIIGRVPPSSGNASRPVPSSPLSIRTSIMIAAGGTFDAQSLKLLNITLGVMAIGLNATLHLSGSLIHSSGPIWAAKGGTVNIATSTVLAPLGTGIASNGSSILQLVNVAVLGACEPQIDLQPYFTFQARPAPFKHPSFDLLSGCAAVDLSFSRTVLMPWLSGVTIAVSGKIGLRMQLDAAATTTVALGEEEDSTGIATMTSKPIHSELFDSANPIHVAGTVVGIVLGEGTFLQNCLCELARYACVIPVTAPDFASLKGGITLSHNVFIHSTPYGIWPVLRHPYGRVVIFDDVSIAGFLYREVCPDRIACHEPVEVRGTMAETGRCAHNADVGVVIPPAFAMATFPVRTPPSLQAPKDLSDQAFGSSLVVTGVSFRDRGITTCSPTFGAIGVDSAATVGAPLAEVRLERLDVDQVATKVLYSDLLAPWQKTCRGAPSTPLLAPISSSCDPTLQIALSDLGGVSAATNVTSYVLHPRAADVGPQALPNPCTDFGTSPGINSKDCSLVPLARLRLDARVPGLQFANLELGQRIDGSQPMLIFANPDYLPHYPPPSLNDSSIRNSNSSNTKKAGEPQYLRMALNRRTWTSAWSFADMSVVNRLNFFPATANEYELTLTCPFIEGGVNRATSTLSVIFSVAVLQDFDERTRSVSLWHLRSNTPMRQVDQDLVRHPSNKNLFRRQTFGTTHQLEVLLSCGDRIAVHQQLVAGVTLRVLVPFISLGPFEPTIREAVARALGVSPQRRVSLTNRQPETSNSEPASIVTAVLEVEDTGCGYDSITATDNLNDLINASLGSASLIQETQDTLSTIAGVTIEFVSFTKASTEIPLPQQEESSLLTLAAFAAAFTFGALSSVVLVGYCVNKIYAFLRRRKPEDPMLWDTNALPDSTILDDLYITNIETATALVRERRWRDLTIESFVAKALELNEEQRKLRAETQTQKSTGSSSSTTSTPSVSSLRGRSSHLLMNAARDSRRHRSTVAFGQSFRGPALLSFKALDTLTEDDDRHSPHISRTQSKIPFGRMELSMSLSRTGTSDPTSGSKHHSPAHHQGNPKRKPDTSATTNNNNNGMIPSFSGKTEDYFIQSSDKQRSNASLVVVSPLTHTSSSSSTGRRRRIAMVNAAATSQHHHQQDEIKSFSGRTEDYFDETREGRGDNDANEDEEQMSRRRHNDSAFGDREEDDTTNSSHTSENVFAFAGIETISRPASFAQLPLIRPMARRQSEEELFMDSNANSAFGASPPGSTRRRKVAASPIFAHGDPLQARGDGDEGEDAVSFSRAASLNSMGSPLEPASPAGIVEGATTSGVRKRRTATVRLVEPEESQ